MAQRSPTLLVENLVKSEAGSPQGKKAFQALARHADARPLFQKALDQGFNPACPTWFLALVCDPAPDKPTPKQFLYKDLAVAAIKAGASLITPNRLETHSNLFEWTSFCYPGTGWTHEFMAAADLHSPNVVLQTVLTTAVENFHGEDPMLPLYLALMNVEWDAAQTLLSWHARTQTPVSLTLLTEAISHAYIKQKDRVAAFSFLSAVPDQAGLLDSLLARLDPEQGCWEDGGILEDWVTECQAVVLHEALDLQLPTASGESRIRKL
jgi:hypothetical protein